MLFWFCTSNHPRTATQNLLSQSYSRKKTTCGQQRKLRPYSVIYGLRYHRKIRRFANSKFCLWINLHYRYIVLLSSGDQVLAFNGLRYHFDWKNHHSSASLTDWIRVVSTSSHVPHCDELQTLLSIIQHNSVVGTDPLVSVRKKTTFNSSRIRMKMLGLLSRTDIGVHPFSIQLDENVE